MKKIKRLLMLSLCLCLSLTLCACVKEDEEVINADDELVLEETEEELDRSSDVSSYEDLSYEAKILYTYFLMEGKKCSNYSSDPVDRNKEEETLDFLNYVCKYDAEVKKGLPSKYKSDYAAVLYACLMLGTKKGDGMLLLKYANSMPSVYNSYTDYCPIFVQGEDVFDEAEEKYKDFI